MNANTGAEILDRLCRISHASRTDVASRIRVGHPGHTHGTVRHRAARAHDTRTPTLTTVVRKYPRVRSHTETPTRRTHTLSTALHTTQSDAHRESQSVHSPVSQSVTITSQSPVSHSQPAVSKGGRTLWSTSPVSFLLSALARATPAAMHVDVRGASASSSCARQEGRHTSHRTYAG